MTETDQLKRLQRLLLQLLNSIFDDREYLYIMSRLCGYDQDFDTEELNKMIKNIPRKLHEQKEIYDFIKENGGGEIEKDIL